MPDMLRLNVMPPVADAIKADNIVYTLPGEEEPLDITPGLMAGRIVETLHKLAAKFRLREQGSGRILVHASARDDVAGLADGTDQETIFLSEPFIRDQMTPEQIETVTAALSDLPGILAVDFANLVPVQAVFVRGLLAETANEAPAAESVQPSPTAIDFGARVWSSESGTSDLAARLAKVRARALRDKGRAP